MTAIATPAQPTQVDAAAGVPDLATYYAIHAALRLGGQRLAIATAQVDPADRRQVKALVRYWHGYDGEVQAHHTTEDQIFFPALVERVPEVAGHLERVARDHHLLDELAQSAAAAMQELAYGGDIRPKAPVFRQLALHMDEHLDFEDVDLVPMFAAHVDKATYDVLEARAQKLLGIGKQAAFTVPFVATSVTPAERDHLLASAPAAFRLLHRLTRGSHQRMLQRAFGV